MLQMLSSSQGLVGCSAIGGWLTAPRKELNEEFTLRIALARQEPILVKNLQNLSAISTGSVIVLPSDANDEGKGDLLLRLIITSLSNFQVVLRSFLALSNLVSQYLRFAMRIKRFSLFLQVFYFRSLDNEGDLMNFLYNLFFLLIDFKSPGVIQGELQLFSSLPLMTFKGKQALQTLEYLSILLL